MEVDGVVEEAGLEAPLVEAVEHSAVNSSAMISSVSDSKDGMELLS